MLRLCLMVVLKLKTRSLVASLLGMTILFSSQVVAAAENEHELFKTMSSLLEQANPEIDNLAYLKQIHRMADLKRITPIEELYIKILVASGVEPLPLSGFERNILDVLKQSFPYFGSELAFYYQKHHLILLPGFCHWSYLHFEKLNSWLNASFRAQLSFRARSARNLPKILYALPEQKFTEEPPLISKESLAAKFEQMKVPFSTYLLSFGGRWFSHLSWGAINTVVGGAIAAGYIIGGVIFDQDFSFSFDNGSLIVSSLMHKIFYSDFSVGPFYFTGSGKYDTEEAGHTYQSALLGPFYLPLAGISLLYTQNPDHTDILRNFLSGHPDTLLNFFAGHVDRWGEIDEELKTGISKQGEMDLIKKIPRIMVTSPLNSSFETVLEILLNEGADLEVIRYLKRFDFKDLKYFLLIPLPLKKYLYRISPSHRSTLKRTLKLYFPKIVFSIGEMFIHTSSGWEENRSFIERERAYEELLNRLETEEPLTESFWLDMTSSFLTLDQKKDLFQKLLQQLNNTSRALDYRERLQRRMKEWLHLLWSPDVVDPREYYLKLNMPLPTH